jgi:hypothetical protein
MNTYNTDSKLPIILNFKLAVPCKMVCTWHFSEKLDVKSVTVLWRIDLLLGNDHETTNQITAIARQQILSKQQLNYNNEEQSFLCNP